MAVEVMKLNCGIDMPVIAGIGIRTAFLSVTPLWYFLIVA